MAAYSRFIENENSAVGVLMTLSFARIRKNAERVRLIAKTGGRERAVDKGENGVVLLILQLACHNEHHLLVVRQLEYRRGQRWDAQHQQQPPQHICFLR